MKFSDNIIRSAEDQVCIIRNENEIQIEFDGTAPLSWDEERFNFMGKKGVTLYSCPAADAKIGESIYDKNGRFLAYRSE